MMLKDGELEKEHFTIDLPTLTHQDMFHLALEKLLKTPSHNNTFMNMSKDLD